MAERDAEAGVIASVRRLAATLVAVVHTRLGLLSNELEEERVRVAQMLVLGAIALFCGFIGVLLLTLTIVVAFWESHRLIALVALTIAYLVGFLVAGIVLKGKAARRSRLFSASLAELARDRDSLGHP